MAKRPMIDYKKIKAVGSNLRKSAAVQQVLIGKMYTDDTARRKARSELRNWQLREMKRSAKAITEGEKYTPTPSPLQKKLGENYKRFLSNAMKIGNTGDVQRQMLYQLSKVLPKQKERLEKVEDAVQTWEANNMQRAARPQVYRKGREFTVSATPLEDFIDYQIGRLDKEARKVTGNLRRQLHKRGMKSGQKAKIHKQISKRMEPYEKKIETLEDLRGDIEKERR